MIKYPAVGGFVIPVMLPENGGDFLEFEEVDADNIRQYFTSEDEKRLYEVKSKKLVLAKEGQIEKLMASFARHPSKVAAESGSIKSNNGKAKSKIQMA